MMTRGETFQYRNNNQQVTLDDYFMATKVEFSDIASEWSKSEMDELWENLAANGCEFHKSPLSDSEYMIDRKTGDIYRRSSHWGRNISTCCWTLRRGVCLLTMCYTIAKANIANFEAIVTPDYIIRKYMSNINS